MEYTALLLFVINVCLQVGGQLQDGYNTTGGENQGGHGGFFAQCCIDGGGKPGFTQEENEMNQQCLIDVGKEGEMVNGQPTYDCVTQCYGEKKGMVDREGYVISDEFINQVLEYFSEESIKNVVRNVAPKCVEHCNEHAKGLRAKDPKKYRCSPAMTYVNLCTYMDVELNCPAERRDNSDRCENLRKSIEAFKKSMFP